MRVLDATSASLHPGESVPVYIRNIPSLYQIGHMAPKQLLLEKRDGAGLSSDTEKGFH